MAKEDPNALFLGNLGQKALIFQNGKILLCRAIGFDNWDLPGGRLHKAEEPVDGLVREIQEELGVRAKIGNPFSVAVTEETFTSIPRYFVVFEASLVNPHAEFVLAPDEIAEVRWVAPEEVDGIQTWDHWRELLNTYFKTH